jgi:hypothetical protein
LCAFVGFSHHICLIPIHGPYTSIIHILFLRANTFRTVPPLLQKKFVAELAPVALKAPSSPVLWTKPFWQAPLLGLLLLVQNSASSEKKILVTM